MLVAPLCTIASFGLRLAKSSTILSAVKGLIITVAAYSTPPRELPSPAHTTLHLRLRWVRVEGRACALAGHHPPVILRSHLETHRTHGVEEVEVGKMRCGDKFGW
ncbi:hypothetical protein AAG906_003382 [Vitis piasezkii]